METIEDLHKRQLDMEMEGVALGAQRYNKARPMPWRSQEDALAEQDEAELPPGRRLMRQIVGPMVAVIEADIEAASVGRAGRGYKALPLLRVTQPEAVAYLTARSAINGVSRRLSMAQLARIIAEQLKDHIDYAKLREDEPAFFQSLMRANAKAGTYGKTWRGKIRRAMRSADVLLTNWSQADKLNVGTKCIDMLLKACPSLFEITIEHNPVTGRKENVFRPKAVLSTWLEKMHDECALLNPVNMPMMCPPVPWTSPTDGGYLGGNGWLVKGAPKDYMEELADHDMPLLYDALNAIQSVPWRINVRVLDVMRATWSAGTGLGGLPEREPRVVPEKPHDIDTNDEALKKWCKRAAIVHQDNARNASRRLYMAQLLWMGEKFAPEKAIYYPHNVDFRGRVYPLPKGGPDPQGDDLAKSLIEFSEAKPVGNNGHWLAVHLANLFGMDKVSFADRIRWVMENEELILDSAQNPLGGERFWATADAPYCALAACFEWQGYVNEGEDFKSRLPIALDGSNSGLQHFSAMLRDPHGAAAVNLVPTNKPADVYMTVARAVQAIVDASSEPEAQAWKGGKVIRKIAKRPVMTYCYAATRYGMQKMIADQLVSIDLENRDEGKPPHLDGADNHEAAKYLSHVMYEAIGQSVRAASGAMDWLKTTSKIVAKTGEPVRWTSPIGMPVRQHYWSMNRGRVKVYVNGREVYYNVENPSKRVDVRGQASAVAPNFVHSCDASHLMQVVLACRAEGISSIAVIHDSFGTHAADTTTLSALLRRTMVEQYSGNLLAEFKTEIAYHLDEESIDELPELPSQGSLDLDELRDASYAFA